MDDNIQSGSFTGEIKLGQTKVRKNHLIQTLQVCSDKVIHKINKIDEIYVTSLNTKYKTKNDLIKIN